MKTVLKLGLILGGLALLFKDQLSEEIDSLFGADEAPTPQPTTTTEQSSSPASTPTSTSPATTSPATTTATTTTTTNTLAQEMLRRRGSNSATYDQWNYYYQELTGVYAPAIEDVLPGKERGFTMTVEDWFSAVDRYRGALSGLLAAARRSDRGPSRGPRGLRW